MESAGKKIGIVIADNQYLIVEALKFILTPHYDIKDIVSSNDELFESLKSETPEILILDHSLFDRTGLDDIRQIRNFYPEMPILLLTNNLSLNELSVFNKIGIKTLLHKNAGRDELFSGIQAALQKKKYYSDSILDMLFDLNNKKSSAEETGRLTSSEIEIVKLIAQGLTTKEIAEKKFLSSHTIMTHRKNIFRKLNISNASELTMYAVRSGIVDTIEYHI